jgi:hypothetical protein
MVTWAGSAAEKFPCRTPGGSLRWRRHETRWVPAAAVGGVLVAMAMLGQAVAGPAAPSRADTARTVVDSLRTTAAPGPDTLRAAAADTGMVTPPPRPTPLPFLYSAFDTVLQHDYLLKRPNTLDNYMENEPRFFLGRRGPIGSSVLLSRYAFGRGRCSVYLNDTPVNNPQDDVAPLAQIPVSGLQWLVEEAGAGESTPPATGLEGRLRIVEEPPPPQEPTTFFNLSKSTQRNLRQRRVWFASMRGPIGLDFGYDEVLNDGYSFDARRLNSENFVNGPGYGSSHTRYVTANLRGDLPGGDAYLFSLRRLTADTVGDLRSADSEVRLVGHLANVSAWIGAFRLNLFSRGYDATARPAADAAPDSNTINLTTAAYLDWSLRSGGRSIGVGGGFENIESRQVVGGGRSEDAIHKSSARITAVSGVGAGISVRAQLSGVYYRDLTKAWGCSFAAVRKLGRHDLELYVSRDYRMPNLGELFLPPHSSGIADTVTISGNRDLDSEYGWELGGRLATGAGPFTNELRGFTLDVHRAIAFDRSTVGGEDWLVAQNGGRETAYVIEDRLRMNADFKGWETRLSGSVSRTFGDRTSYFIGVPRWNAHASFRFGRSLFQATSALYIGLDYTYRSTRRTLAGGNLPAYNLLNLKLEGRLLGAELYLLMMNTLDEQYQTIEGYLMTPRTLVYGIAWELFD